MDSFDFLFNPFVIKITVYLVLAFGILMMIAGYRFFKLIIGISGFLGGFGMGVLLAIKLGHSETLYLLMFGILLGILVSVVAVVIYFVGVFIMGAMLGFALAFNLTAWISLPHANGLAMVAAIAFGILAIVFQRSMIIVASSAVGAWWSAVSLGNLMGWVTSSRYAVLMFPRSLSLIFSSPLIVGVAVIGLIIGLTVQFSCSRRD
ncbi:MAG: DUF4203 domain-containing protein [Candidatus Delongbacteria bacterium]|nr:DUF4203 domain-containing protein [Candidatus Delongbacteria bacterium]